MKRFTVIFFVIAALAVPTFAGDYIVMAKKGADIETAVSELGGTIGFYHAPTGYTIVRGIDADSAELLGNTAASLVLEDVEVSLPEFETSLLAESFVDDNSPSDPELAFFYPRAWNLRAIGADQAWAAGKLGSRDVTVAVLDSGIDYGHPDLAGLVDLSRSASFMPFDDLLTSIYFPGRHPVTDLRYHGTHVAATIASNAYVQAGVTSNVTLIGVKVLGYNGSGASSGVLAGILYAADNGADVINMSLGGAFVKYGSEGYHGQVINQVLQYAEKKGAVVVVAAGNNNWDLDHYVELKKDFGLQASAVYSTYCDAPNVVCVSATGPAAADSVNGPYYDINAFAGYSNYGRSAIDVAAPGGNAVPVYAACTQTSLLYPVCSTGNYVIGLGGTSMAAPHAAGLAALIVSDIGSGNPAQVRAAMRNGADDLGATGTDPYYGKGFINVPASLGLD